MLVVIESSKCFFNICSVSFKSIIKQAYENRISLSATGFYATPEIKWDRLTGKGNPFYYFAYGAAVTEVIIDTLTGENPTTVFQEA